jgi:hypothetical protein
MPTVEKRIENEKRLYRALIDHLEQRGFKLHSVNDGEEIHEVNAHSKAEEVVFSVDESWTFFVKDGDRHYVYIILGNGNDGYDLIADYSFIKGDPNGFAKAMEDFTAQVHNEEEQKEGVRIETCKKQNPLSVSTVNIDLANGRSITVDFTPNGIVTTCWDTQENDEVALCTKYLRSSEEVARMFGFEEYAN